MVLMCWGMVRALRIELLKRSALRDARVMPHGPHAALNWQRRLRNIIHQPKRHEVVRFLREVALPALDEVAAELGRQGLTVRTGGGQEEGGDGRVWVEVGHGEEIDFFYSVRPRAYEPPSFVIADTVRERAEALKYYRAEVHLREGGQDYDIMGWAKGDIINDVLDQYERHMHFLNAMR